MRNVILEIKAMLAPAEKHVEDYKAGWHECLKELQAEYDKLCPKPSEFPDGYEWFSIDAHNLNIFHKEKPKSYVRAVCWAADDERGIPEHISYLKSVPLGLDWRLCCWSLDDAKRIHGEGK